MSGQDVTGRVLPMPDMLTVPALATMPSRVATAFARCSDKVLLLAVDPMRSVWPVTEMDSICLQRPTRSL
ncbi:hypothetical protein IMCC9480_3610 [Oxalobacteraceae bacterium IMCC9480]|nr:hypothetical protein IMCC9480_3610 [Oxalobacteraceae bacterium IMCC9480]